MSALCYFAVQYAGHQNAPHDTWAFLVNPPVVPQTVGISRSENAERVSGFVWISRSPQFLGCVRFAFCPKKYIYIYKPYIKMKLKEIIPSVGLRAFWSTKRKTRLKTEHHLAFPIPKPLLKGFHGFKDQLLRMVAWWPCNANPNVTVRSVQNAWK